MTGKAPACAVRPDPLTPEQRRLCMSRIRATDTKPELIVRQGLHALGLRYRLHDRDLTGTPDLVFPRYRALLFIHGCFWHGHDCPLFKLPASRTDFWKAKIGRNQSRDTEALAALNADGWRTLVVWECAMRGRSRLPLEEFLGRCFNWITQALPSAEIRGAWSPAGAASRG